MGSPISVVITEIVMQKIEEIILENPSNIIYLWKRYVNDVSAIILERKRRSITNFDKYS